MDEADKIETMSTEKDEMLWGAAPIGKVINRSPRQTYNLLEKGLIKSAKRIGGRWSAGRRNLRREFYGANQ